jgi:hypothetical protein
MENRDHSLIKRAMALHEAMADAGTDFLWIKHRNPGWLDPLHIPPRQGNNWFDANLLTNRAR